MCRLNPETIKCRAQNQKTICHPECVLNCVTNTLVCKQKSIWTSSMELCHFANLFRTSNSAYNFEAPPLAVKYSISSGQIKRIHFICLTAAHTHRCLTRTLFVRDLWKWFEIAGFFGILGYAKVGYISEHKLRFQLRIAWKWNVALTRGCIL